MSKILQLLCLSALIAISTQLTAQTGSGFKFTHTSFVGALDKDLAKDWTVGWTNWDPKSTVYPDPNDLSTLNGMDATLPVPGEKDITTTVSLNANSVYLLQGFIVVRDGGKLIIPAGTIIRCHSDLSASPKNYASIIVERGGKIDIQGTLEKPVILTSNKGVGLRDRGDWGGLLLAGRSTHNQNDNTYNNVQMEGFNNVSFDPNLAKFGGNNVDDNSGSISYLRIEFGGIAFEINKEINGMTFGAVGAGTSVDHVQVSYSGDDSFEWFGGTVNSSHLIAFKGTDDDFDTDNGYRGLSQFGIGIRDSAYYDLTYSLPSGGSTSEGFESDNEATGTAYAKPYTNGIFCNFTMVGPVPVGSTWADMNAVTKAAFRRGARIRRNSGLRVVNSIFMGYRNFLMMDGDSSIRNTNFPEALALVVPNTPVDQSARQSYFTNNLIVNTKASKGVTDTTGNGLVEVARAAGCQSKLNAINDWVRQSGLLANNIDPVEFVTGTVLVNPLASSKTPDFRPVSNSPALTGANFYDHPILKNLTFGLATHDIDQVLAAPVYPNPIMNGVLHFGKQVVSFGIFDMDGNLVRYGLDTDSTSVDGLSKGIYFIKLDGKAQKLIVQ